jgi:hypothetical protein
MATQTDAERGENIEGASTEEQRTIEESRAVLSETARELSSDSASPYPRLGPLTRNDRQEHSNRPFRMGQQVMQFDPLLREQGNPLLSFFCLSLPGSTDIVR